MVYVSTVDSNGSHRTIGTCMWGKYPMWHFSSVRTDNIVRNFSNFDAHRLTLIDHYHSRFSVHPLCQRNVWLVDFSWSDFDPLNTSFFESIDRMKIAALHGRLRKSLILCDSQQAIIRVSGPLAPVTLQKLTHPRTLPPTGCAHTARVVHIFMLLCVWQISTSKSTHFNFVHCWVNEVDAAEQP